MGDPELELAVATVAEVCRLTARLQGEIAARGAAVAKDDRSPVTAADLAVQVVVSSRLAEAFPDDPLLAEESSAPLRGRPELAAEVTALAASLVPGLTLAEVVERLDRSGHEGSGRHWVLDPIDGTKGFVRGDQYAVVLALVEDDRPVLGVLGCPNLGPGGRLMAARRDRGAFEHDLSGANPRRIATDAVDRPHEAVLCTSVEYDDQTLAATRRLAGRAGIVRPFRRLDSQCKYALVARGEASVYLRLPRAPGYREKVWDHAAGLLLVEEAGGRVTDLAGRAIELGSGSELTPSAGFLASNGRLHGALLAAAASELGP